MTDSSTSPVPPKEIERAIRAFRDAVIGEALCELPSEVVLYALAQCNHKDLETRSDKRPQIRDFQGASGMAQDADFRGMIYKPDQYESSSPPLIEIAMSGRRISPFDVTLDYDRKSLAIYEKKRVQAAVA